MAVTKKRFIARLAPPPCDGRSGPGPRADIARSTDPYDGTCSSFGLCSLPAGSTEQPHVPARRGGLTLRSKGRCKFGAGGRFWGIKRPGRAGFEITPPKHAPPRVVGQGHVVEGFRQPASPRLPP